jgi:enoyl-CoA hydratase/carnithine racemase
VELILFEPMQGYARIRLNRPQKRNAMSAQLRAELRTAMKLAREHFHVLILTGVDDIFCGGIDLKEVQSEAAQGSQAALSDWRELSAEIREHPSIFIAAVNGLALGGGVTLTGVCDLAIASDDALFGLPEVGFGMYPNPAGPAAQLSLSRKRAAWMVLTAERISAAQAQAWGLINEVVPRAQLDQRTETIATRIAQFDAATLSACKRALDDIPLMVNNWRDAFSAGVSANDAIAASSSHAAHALELFTQGERNTGQGQ